MILDGKLVSSKIIDELKPIIDTLIQSGHRPCLSVILVGDNPDSEAYVSMKIKMCHKLQITSKVYRFQESVTQDEIIETIHNLNNDNTIHGILVQLPLPKHLDVDLIMNGISHKKDVDGFHVMNSGKLFQNRDIQFVPCTPLGCIELLDHYQIDVKGLNVTIIGCSNIVGLPLSLLLLRRGATITICHIDTKDTKEMTKDADMIIACCGAPLLVKEDWIKQDTIIIDIGFNTISKDNKRKIVGDVDFDSVKDKVCYITPVPGGVGPMTIAMLMKQTVLATEIMTKKFM